MIGHRISLQRILFSRKYMYSLLLRKLYPVCILWIQSLIYYLHCDCFTLLIRYNGFYYIDILYAGNDNCILLHRKSNPLQMIFHTNYVCRTVRPYVSDMWVTALRQTITWNNAGLSSIKSLETKLSETGIKVRNFSTKMIHLDVTSTKWRLFCLGFNLL